jgi:hypothetical protein
MWEKLSSNIHPVETIQLVHDAELLRAHFRSLEVRDRERRDREGYARHPDSMDEPAVWDKVAEWPED